MNNMAIGTSQPAVSLKIDYIRYRGRQVDKVYIPVQPCCCGCQPRHNLCVENNHEGCNHQDHD